MMIRTHRFLLVPLLAFASLAWAACGSADRLSSSASAAEAVRLAGQNAGNESHSLELTIRMKMSGLGELAMQMEGEFDAANNRGRVSANFVGMEMDAITDGATTYTRLAGSDEWFKTEVDVPQPVVPGGGFDAAQQLAYLRMVSDDVREVGSERLRGRETTKYRAFVSFERVLDQFNSADRELIEQMSQYLSGDGFDMLVWIDDEGRPAKIEYSVDMRIAGSNMSATYVMEFFDWGKPVTVELPPADKIVDAPAFNLFGG